MLRRTTCGDMPAADGESVAVAAGHQHQQFRVGQLDPLGDGQGAAMHGVEPVGFGVTRNAARTTDARDEGDFVRRPADRRQRPRDGRHHAEIAAARAPDGLEVAFEIAGLEFGGGNGFEGSHRLVFGWPGQSLARSGWRWLRLPWSATTISRSRSSTSRRLNGVGAAPGERSDQGRKVHVHPDQPVKLRLEGLLDEQPALDRGEEVLVNRFGHRIEQFGDEQFGVQPFRLRQPQRFPGHARPRSPNSPARWARPDRLPPRTNRGGS